MFTPVQQAVAWSACLLLYLCLSQYNKLLRGQPVCYYICVYLSTTSCCVVSLSVTISVFILVQQAVAWSACLLLYLCLSQYNKLLRGQPVCYYICVYPSATSSCVVSMSVTISVFISVQQAVEWSVCLLLYLCLSQYNKLLRGQYVCYYICVYLSTTSCCVVSMSVTISVFISVQQAVAWSVCLLLYLCLSQYNKLLRGQPVCYYICVYPTATSCCVVSLSITISV